MKHAIPLLALALALAPAAAQAQTQPEPPTQPQTLRGVWFIGGTVSESASGYAGGVVSLPGESLGHGLAIRVSVSGGKYHYDAGATPITADYAGAETAVVYQLSGTWGWANLSAGPKFAHTRLSPIDPGNKLRGSRWDLGLQSDGALDRPHWRLGWFGSYGVANQAYQAKLQLGRKLAAGTFRLGAEAGIQGDPSYKKGIFGGFVSKTIGRALEVEISGGVTEQHGRGARAYGSLGLSRVF